MLLLVILSKSSNPIPIATDCFETGSELHGISQSQSLMLILTPIRPLPKFCDAFNQSNTTVILQFHDHSFDRVSEPITIDLYSNRIEFNFVYGANYENVRHEKKVQYSIAYGNTVQVIGQIQIIQQTQLNSTSCWSSVSANIQAAVNRILIEVSPLSCQVDPAAQVFIE